MNPLLKKLNRISQKKERRIIGLMSGTSMDGLDIALCRFSGSGLNTRFSLENFSTVPYPPDVRHQLIAFATAVCLDPQMLCIWHTNIANVHAGFVNDALREWKVMPDEIDLVASHGQTLYHAPVHKHKIQGMPNTTIQIGDGDHIAVRTGIITISDFRQKDTARGNEGAPLAAYGDYLLFKKQDVHRVFLNIGGISNFTWLEAGSDLFPPVSFDTGPGNTLIDAATRKYYDGLNFDMGGGLAARGKVHKKLLNILKNHSYFQQNPPKTTGFELFHLNWVEQCMADHDMELPAEDLLATLTRLTVETVSEQIRAVLPEDEPAEVFVSGGGAFNSTLMNGLAEELDSVPVATIAALGIDIEAKEALIFGVLANELVCGKDLRLHLGKISLPDH